MDTSHKGARGELLASAWLLARGLEVFRNVAASGPADLVAWDRETDRMIRIDVKNFSSNFVKKDGSISAPRPSQKAFKHGIHLLYLRDGEVLGFINNEGDFYDPLG